MIQGLLEPLFSPSLKNKNNKIKLILKRIIFLQKKVFLIFQEMELSSLKDKALQEGTIWAQKTLK